MTQQPIAGDVPQWTLADRLRKAREHAGIEQADFAARIDVSRRSVTNYEKGHSTPRRPVLISWALGTGVDLEWLTNGGGEGLPRLDSNQRPSDYTFDSKVSGGGILIRLRDRRSRGRAPRHTLPVIEASA